MTGPMPPSDGSLFNDEELDSLIRSYEATHGNQSSDPDHLLSKRIAWHRADAKARQVVAEEQAGSEGGTDAIRRIAIDAMRGKLLDREALRDLPPARYLIKGVLDFDSETWLIGASGGFKSFMAIDWACHVAMGIPWWGCRVRKGKVLYIVGEGVKGIAQRVAAWEIAHRTTVTNLYIHPGPVQVRGAGDRDAISFDWHTLCQMAAEEGPALVILDTQARMTVGLEENSNTSMGVWIEGVRLLRAATGACILVVHHTGRNGLDARGASALDGAQDTEWKVTRIGEKAKRCAKLNCEKHKDGNDDQSFDFQAHVVDLGSDEDGDPITSLTLRPLTAELARHIREEDVEPDAFTYDADRNLTPNQAEVMAVLRGVVTARGETIAAILRMVNERRKERAARAVADYQPMPRTSVVRALESLESAELAVALGKAGSRFVDAEKWTGDEADGSPDDLPFAA